MHQRLRNSVANPASGPDCSVPATGWAGTRCTPAGRCGSSAAITAPLTEPTSETIAPRLQRRRDFARERFVGADGRAENDEIRAQPPPRAAEAVISSPSPSARRAIQRRRRAVRDRDPLRDVLAPRRARDRGADEADADDREPLEQRLGERGPEPVRHGRPPFMNSASAATTPRWPLRSRPSCAGNPAARRPPPRAGRSRARSGTGRRRPPSARSRRRNRNSRKLPTLGVTPIPSAAISLLSHGSQRALCAAAASTWAASAIAATPAASAAPLRLKGGRTRLSAADDRAPAHRPSRCASSPGRGFSRTCASSRRSPTSRRSSMPAA